MKKFKVTGKIEISFKMEIEAERPSEAELIADKNLSDAYHLSVFGYYHDPENDVDVSIRVKEI